MKSVSEYDRKIWLSDYSQKVFDVSIGGEWIPTAKFNAESLKITQILDDSSQLEFIGCKAAKLELTIIDTDEEYEGKEIRVYAGAYIEGMQGTQKIRLFNGTIAEVKQKSHDDIMVTLVAYDNLADILQMDLAEWYKGLTFPMTLGAFVRALPFRYFPWEDLPFENLMIEKTIEPDVLPAKDVLAAITTLNGRYCVWDDSYFKLIALKRYEHDGLFPADDLYPADDLFPMDPTTNAEHIPDEEYFKAEYQDYDVQGIDKVQIRSEENDIGAIYGTGSNAYIIQGNFLLFGKSAADLASIAQRVYEEVQGFVFVPAKIECKSRPWVECGDLVRVYTEKKVVYTYVMQRTLSGMSFMHDSYSAKQGNVRNEQVNSLNTQIIQLKGKANKLVRDVEHLSSEIYNEDGSSKIEQNAEAIEARVEKTGGGQSFSWELLADGFVLKANGQEVFRCDAGGITVSGYATSTRMESAEANITSLYANEAALGELIAQKASIENLNATNVRVGNLEGDHVSVSSFNALSGTVNSINANYISTGTLSTQIASLSGVTAKSINCSEYLANYGNVAYKLTPHRFTVGGAARTILASAN